MTQTYHFKNFMAKFETRPDMIVADVFGQAVSAHVEYNLPVAIVGFHMHALSMPCSYISEEPTGFPAGKHDNLGSCLDVANDTE
ncbi:hypothetical protein KEM54_002727 [Ascosphaera aggregata]|nr:hypothetical protein KEM54_002727 [Ascosphaera aggregata]